MAEAAFRSSRSLTRDRSWAVQMFGWLSSIWLAASLMGVLAAIIAIAPWYEKAYGAVAARTHIYHASWFDALFALLALNIAGAALVRWPWRRRHIGFVTVHAGLLLLIAGFVVAGKDRLDGLLLTRPGVEVAEVGLPGDTVTAILPDGRRAELAVDSVRHGGYPSFARYLLALLSPRPLPELGVAEVDLPVTASGALRVRVSGIALAADGVLTWAEGLDGAPRVGVALEARTPEQSRPTRVAQGWYDPAGGEQLALGPLRGTFARLREPAALAAFLDPQAESASHGRVAFAWRGRSATWTVDPAAVPATLALDAEHAIEVQRVFTGFRLVRGQPTDDPAAGENPAVQYRYGVRGADGQMAWLTSFAFARYQFNPHADGVEAVYRHPLTHRRVPGQLTMEMQAVEGPGARLHVRRWSGSRGFLGADTFTAGTHRLPLVDGAMQLDAELAWLPSAVPRPRPVRMKPEQIDRADRWIELAVSAGGREVRQWLRRGSFAALTATDPEGRLVSIQAHVRQSTYDLRERHGFAVRLDQHTAARDPGTERSAAFTSRITILPRTGPGRQLTTVMNEPAVHDGVMLFQTSSFQLSDEHGAPTGEEGMVFTAATDPGLILKYVGTCVLVAGILLLYILRSAAVRRRP